ncbi:MAG: cupin domain-containing protein [Colwellia sp.]
MHQIQWGNLTAEIFLKEYWQKKPLLIKNAFPDFVDPISADELAGLAMEEHIESRIISSVSNSSSQTPQVKNWQVAHGPFDDFSQFGEQDWTLLVQAVNNFSADTHGLLSAVNFLPSWRVDDVMVSFSTPNGGVGAHLDQYDVFIIQGQGSRRWQVGLPDSSLDTLFPHEDLKQVSVFTPVIDEITQVGDLLYIPPNHPHNGVSIENSLNFSIGFQAPNNQELYSALADKLIDTNMAESRFTDKERVLTKSPEHLCSQDISALKSFMIDQLNDDDFFNHFIANTLTQCHHPLEILIPVTPFTQQQIKQLMLDDNAQFTAVSGIKALVLNESTTHNNLQRKSALSINGEYFALDHDTQPLGQLLAQKKPLTKKVLKSFAGYLKNTQLLTSVVNKGLWFIE